MNTPVSLRNKLIASISVALFLTGSVLTGCSLFGVSANPTLQVSGIALEQDQNAQMVSTPEQSSPYRFCQQTDNYDALLTQDARDLYQAIGQQVYAISQEKHVDGYYSLGQIAMPGTVGDEQVRMAITAFKNDHPEIFWIANVYSKAYSGNRTIVRLYSCISADECEQLIQQVDQALHEILSELPDNLSELDREIFLFQAIAGRCVYDTNAVNNPSQWDAYTICGPLVRGKAVCEGYARTMQLLLSYADMECRLINGEAGGTVHMWNLVRVDGNWYHLDPTWNDNNEVVRYDYFNVTDAVIQKDHDISIDITTLSEQDAAEFLNSGTASYNLPLPACVSDFANYLKQKGVLISGFTRASDSRAVDALVRAVNQGEPAVYFYIGDSLNYSMAVNKLFNTQPYQMASYITQANRKLDDNHQIRYDRISYILGEYSHGITVKLDY